MEDRIYELDKRLIIVETKLDVILSEIRTDIREHKEEQKALRQDYLSHDKNEMLKWDSIKEALDNQKSIIQKQNNRITIQWYINIILVLIPIATALSVGLIGFEEVKAILKFILI